MAIKTRQQPSFIPLTVGIASIAAASSLKWQGKMSQFTPPPFVTFRYLHDSTGPRLYLTFRSSGTPLATCRGKQNGILQLHVCHGCCASSLGRAHGSFVPQRAVRLFATFRGGTSSCRHPACGPRQKTEASGTSRNGRSCCSCQEHIRGSTCPATLMQVHLKFRGHAYQTVLAQPKLSIIGLVCRTRVWRSDPAAVTSARYCRRIFAVSVLPAPDSPEITTDCEAQASAVHTAHRGNGAGRFCVADFQLVCCEMSSAQPWRRHLAL